MKRLLTLVATLTALSLAAAPVPPGLAGPMGWSVAPDTLVGVVLEISSERPVPTARVELLRGGRTAASTRTDREGGFRLPLRDWPGGAATIRVERFGYHAVERSVEAGTGEIRVLLSPAPLPLPGFQVEAERDVCETPEDSQARALWEAASRRHLTGLDTLGLATYLRGWTDTLQASSGNGEIDREGEPGQRGSAPLLRLSWDRRVQQEGYAFPVRRTDRARSYSSWSYPPLEADFAPHFIHPTFGRLHRLQLSEEGPQGWTLRFCTRNRRRPWLEGRMELDPDTLLRRVEWSFRTDEPDEAAGGWARFPGALPEADHVPLPTESMTWRRLPDGELLRKAQSYEGWILAPGDSVPFLRSRDEGGEGGREP
jgi:hypothetical protein